MSKMSIRFYKDHKVRAVWDEEYNHWWFSVLDIVGAINQQDDHEKNRNYWKYLKSKLRKEQSEVVSDTTQLKLTASDGKKYLTDVISQAGVDKLAKAIRNQQAMAFLDWFTYSDNTIDGQSRKKAYTLWESNLVADKDVGKVKSLQQIHAYLFGGLYDFADKIRTKTIAKGNTLFCLAEHLHNYLKIVEAMPETTFDEIVEKIDKKDYLNAMIASHTDSSRIHELLKGAMTDKIDDREIFMKGIDYSYYYEQE